MTTAIAWLEDRYEATAAALAKIRRRESLTTAERDVLREAHVEGGAVAVPSVVVTGRQWRWQPGDEPGPLDGRPHP